MAISFAVTLSERDWDQAIGGWRCSALAIPGSQIDSLYVDGNKIDTAWYQTLNDDKVIRWSRATHPETITASVALTEDLSTQDETQKWKRLAIVLPVVGTIVAAVITAIGPGLVAQRKAHDAANEATPTRVGAPLQRCAAGSIGVNTYFDDKSIVPKDICVLNRPTSEPVVRPPGDIRAKDALFWYVFDEGHKPIVSCVCYEDYDH